jgi:hypothetical protein
MKRRPRLSWARPRGLVDFACQWRLEVAGARRFGREAAAGRYLELRYEDLVAEPEARLREVCRFLGLELEPAMLEYHRRVDAAQLADHPRLAEPPTPGTRRWGEQMSPADNERFEAVAGALLEELGYERAFPHASPSARARAALERAAFAARLASWRVSLALVRRSPAWRARQLYIRRISPPAGAP